jgi:outer membrane protein OmpA-like peptidoglycan-associated protein
MNSKGDNRRRWPRLRRRSLGATMAEFVVAAPTLLMVGLGAVQVGLNYHAKSNLNYAAMEAARAGSMAHAKVDDMRIAFGKAMVSYYGGGKNSLDIAKTLAEKVLPDLAPSAALPLGAMRIEIISPTPESFTDYFSPEAAKRLGVSNRVLPSTGLDAIKCPRDRSGCNSNPASNASGQTLADANLLKVRITYGIPASKQVPMVGRFYTWALGQIAVADTDVFRRSLVAAGRIPVVTHTTVRMQSDAIENSAMVSSPGPGNNGTPSDPGVPLSGDLPNCGQALTCGEKANETPVTKTTGSENCGGACCPAGKSVVTTQETVSSDVLFDFDKATLTSAGKKSLDAMIEQAKTDKPLSIDIYGYTDQIGTDAYNIALSARRAEAVAKYLKDSGAFNGTKFTTTGMGEKNPIVAESACPMADVKAKATCLEKNRRVEFKVTKEVK